MTSERSCWHTVAEKLSPYGKLHRVENPIDRGTPDVAYLLKRKPTLPAVAGWIELKETHKPVKAETPFKIESLSPNQVEFLEGWHNGGGKAFLLCQVERVYAIWEAPQVRPIYKREWTYGQAMSQAMLYWSSPWPIAKILDVIAGPTICG